MDKPSGTVSFLLTGVADSSGLWEASADAAAGAIRRYYARIDAAVSAHGGVWPGPHRGGDRALVVFGSVADALAAAGAMQHALTTGPWPDGIDPRVRIGVHSGEATPDADGTYAGPAVDRCAQLRDIAHGGQVVVSAVTAALAADALPDGVTLHDLGFHRLRDLSSPERVFQLCHPTLETDFGPLRSLDLLANNLPPQLTSFVGRGEDLQAVGKLLDKERLVTLTGAGGSGKTRLAVQAGADLADRWPDGVWWVDLAPVDDPSAVAGLAASVLHVLVDPGAGPLRALTSQLRDRRLLVCLDNCEHLLAACAELADALLRGCPDLAILATSREPLGVAGERLWRVPTLPDDEAIRLFTERARLVRPDFTVDADNEPAVRTVCQRLDGMPLAVELAAAWVRALTVDQIAAGLDDRFRLLTGGPRGEAARRQTLEASVAWSHDLLDEADRTVLRRLAGFAGGFTLDAAEAVCAGEPIESRDVLPGLTRLVDKSLVVVDEVDGGLRYRLLETIRAYAQARLDEAGEGPAVRDRHLDHFLRLAEAAEPELEASDQDAWLGRLETELDNLRIALEWGLAERADQARRLAVALPRWWMLHGHAHQGLQFLRRAVEIDVEDRSSLQARLHFGIAFVSVGAGRFDLLVESARVGAEIAEACGDRRTLGRCLAISAYVGYFADFEAARARCQEARPHSEAVADDLGIDLGLVLEALTWVNAAHPDLAAQLLDPAVERCQRRGDRLLTPFAIRGQGLVALFTGDVRRAERLVAQAREIAEPLGDYFTVGSTTSMLAWIKGTAGDLDGADDLIRPIVALTESAGPDVDVPPISWVLGRLRMWSGDLEAAVAWCQRGLRYGGPLHDNVVVALAGACLCGALRRLGRHEEAQRQVDATIAVLDRLDMTHIRAEVLDESAMLLVSSEPARAEELHHEALAIRVERGLRTSYADSLDALADLAHRADSHDEAVRLLSASDAGREAMGYPRPRCDLAGHQALVDELRAAMDPAAFARAWSEGEALTLDEAVAYVRRARGERRRPTTGWSSLTPTELDVVRLLAEGLSNPDIAARLFISRSTVKTHLSHVYAKLDVSNRTELTRLAGRHLDGG